MSGESLDYHIVKKEQYFLLGKIDSIYQKNSDGFLAENITDKFEFEIKLKAKSIVHCIEIKPRGATKFAIFQLFGEKDKELTSVTEYFDGKYGPKIVMTDCKEKNLVTSKIKVALAGGNDDTAGIVYMLVRGEKYEEKGKKLEPSELKKKHNPCKDFFEDPGRSPHHMAYKTKESSVAVFSDRKKTRDKDEENIKKAIQASKRDMIREEKMEEVVRVIPPKEAKEPEPREYNKVDFEKVKSVFAYVNSAWLEAQRQAEKERGVKESDRLSSKIQVRHFHNRKVAIDVPQPKKAELEKLAEQMGAKILRDPEDFCLFITAKADTEKVSRARKLRNVKILKPEFITNCRKTGAYLQEKDYFHKL